MLLRVAKVDAAVIFSRKDDAEVERSVGELFNVYLLIKASLFPLLVCPSRSPLV